MRRSVRTLLGIAAVTAAASTALTVSAPAFASTAKTSHKVSLEGDYWGYDYSKYYDGSRAKARGQVWEDGSGRIHVDGKLYDKYSPNWLCGYVQVKFENADGDESTYWAKKCGSSGYRYFHFSEDDVDNVQVRTCYWDNYHGVKKYCGRWDYIYEADGDE
ncbi:hypothetical protein [Sphaerisporangium fuscum]|uniref:hypothetical protein n=1 Tax=Sphaerisporangium fuscum TaxID=2835868 RepID=UPI001BDD8296|nr:hypothetical protein [Sphaerisporangium fuscum]